jgi:hypothetical protein
MAKAATKGQLTFRVNRRCREISRPLLPPMYGAG